jgi:mevalonate pyrophosphate decarboxylase
VQAVAENGSTTLDIDRESLIKMDLLITSENNFATASGLASSSSGLSCLAFVLAQLYGVPEAYPGEYTVFARLGSGSACRSLYGGFVQWHRGFEALTELETHPTQVSEHSIAKPVPLSEASLDWWLENLRILICVVKPGELQSL